MCSECNEIVINSCPLCTGKLRKIRYPVRCRFKSLGCEHIIPYKYISKHENRECKYRPYTCPFFSNHYCPITGDIPQIFSHLKDNHMVDVYDDDSFTLNYRQLNLPRHTIVRLYIMSLSHSNSHSHSIYVDLILSCFLRVSN